MPLTGVNEDGEATMIEKHNGNVWIAEFRTVNEFKQFITKTPTNKVFEDYYMLSSKNANRSYQNFTGTESFDEAIDLLDNGWTDKAKELTTKLKAVERDMAPVLKQQRVIGVAGYQPIVPLFLVGAPAAMQSMKFQSVKQKVVTVVKSISYDSGVSAAEWTEQGLKALAVVKKLEASGYRVNVDIVRGGWDSGRYDRKGVVCRVRVKHASERLNASKLAFTMCHPSMQRRLMFRFTETYEKVTKGFKRSYGLTFRKHDWMNVLDKKHEVLLPSFIDGDPNDVKSIDDIEKL
jgi:hypothetical protein|nr:MAG TPA: hypothetical protein [Caudoviricetes sp.]